MAYKILYIEDQNASSIKNSLERNEFEVTVNSATNFDNTLTDIELDVDAYLMDYKLTDGTGRVNAPTYAATIRSKGINKPIILITNEPNLSEFEKDFTNHDAFDFVISKQLFREYFDKYSKRIKSLIDTYKSIVNDDFNISKAIGNSDITLDYRFKEKIEKYTKAKDPYMFCRTICYTLIRSSGLLIGEDILAARLGVDKKSLDFCKLLEIFKDCKYSGILSNSYDRWWFPKVLDKWKEISENKSLRRLNASERVYILKKRYDLKIEAATPIKLSHSTNFWTMCIQTKLPLDPSEGYVVSRRDIEVWQEQEYISLNGILEYPENKVLLSPIDKEYIKKFKG